MDPSGYHDSTQVLIRSGEQGATLACMDRMYLAILGWFCLMTGLVRLLPALVQETSPFLWVSLVAFAVGLPLGVFLARLKVPAS